MKRHFRQLLGLLPAVGIMILIFDSKTALKGAAEGVDLCIRTVIPSLLPFFILSAAMTKSFPGNVIRLFSPVVKICGIPSGHEALLLIGLVGGYPVGAKCINQAYVSGTLDKHCAIRMLGFCSNAGPSFIFGIAATMFYHQRTGWFLWFIHIASAMFTGILLPDRHVVTTSTKLVKATENNDLITGSLKALSTVCGWVILMRVINTYFDRWFLWQLSKTASAAITGFWELTNGCIDLCAIPSESIRFILCSAMLGFGGICVLLQTVSVTKELGLGLYIPGKLLQCSLSITLASLLSLILFREQNINAYPYLIISASAVLIITFLTRAFKKRSRFFEIVCV